MAKVTALQCDMGPDGCDGEVKTWAVGLVGSVREADLCEEHAEPLVVAAAAATRKYTAPRRSIKPQKVSVRSRP